jgi:rare lipoprotein A
MKLDLSMMLSGLFWKNLVLWYTQAFLILMWTQQKNELAKSKFSPEISGQITAKSHLKMTYRNRLMNYQTLTGLTALVATLTLSTAVSATPSVNSTQSEPSLPSKNLISQSVGQASFYGNEPGEGGPLTANGERYNSGGLTAAHRTLPFGTRVRVTSPNTGRSVVVRINDRGPYIGNRIIDLSVGAARAIGLTNSGVGTVRMEVLGGGEGRRQGRRHR